MRQPTLVISRDTAIVKELIEFQIRRPEFKRLVNKFREKYNIKLLGGSTKRKFLGMAHKTIEGSMVWDTDIYIMMRKLNLHGQWKLVLIDYITTGKYSPNSDPEGIAIWKDIQDSPAYREERWMIQIYPSTSKTDIIQAWESIENHFRAGKSVKRKPSPNFERDEYIYHLAVDKGLSYKNISRLVGENFGSENILEQNMLRSIVAKRKIKMKDKRTFYSKI